MSDYFKEGDCVILKSNPEIVIIVAEEEYEGYIYCEWFEGFEKRTSDFKPSTLKKVECPK